MYHILPTSQGIICNRYIPKRGNNTFFFKGKFNTKLNKYV